MLVRPACWRAGDGTPPLWSSYSRQDASESVQDATKSAMIASKMPLGWYKSSQVTSKSSKMPSRPPQVKVKVAIRRRRVGTTKPRLLAHS